MSDNTEECKENKNKEQELEKHRGELVLSIIFILGSIWIMYKSILMSVDVYSRTQPDVYTLPGVFPFIIAVLIILSSMKVLIYAYKKGARLSFLSLNWLKSVLKRRDTRTFLTIIFWMIAYVFILIEYLPFEIATFLFILFLCLVFRATALWKAVLISGIFSVLVVYFFAVVVRTPFPITFF